MPNLVRTYSENAQPCQDLFQECLTQLGLIPRMPNLVRNYQNTNLLIGKQNLFGKESHCWTNHQPALQKFSKLVEPANQLCQAKPARKRFFKFIKPAHINISAKTYQNHHHKDYSILSNLPTYFFRQRFSKLVKPTNLFHQAKPAR